MLFRSDPKVEDYKKYVKHLTHDKYPYVSDVAVKHIIWGEDLIRGKKEIILTEGVFDALLAKQIGYNVISPFTTQLSHAQNERIAEICGKADTVYVIKVGVYPKKVLRPLRDDLKVIL